jgi:tRNA(Arg) A34 adenosine deaminase TadA
MTQHPHHGITELVERFFDVIENDIAPRTQKGVASGNKIFGAAILRKSDLSLVLAETNNEVENPLWHGEMHAIKRFHELPEDARPNASDCVFLTTHEPCSLCLSGITWAGFDNFYFVFSHEDSRDSFAIPYDIQILREVFAVPDPGRNEAAPDRPLYNRTNHFWQAHDITRMIASLDRGGREALLSRLDDIGALYKDLSDAYQKSKGGKGIPLA